MTVRLFDQLEMAVLDSYRDYATDMGYGAELPGVVGKRDGAAQMVETVLDWSPAGVRGPNDEDN